VRLRLGRHVWIRQSQLTIKWEGTLIVHTAEASRSLGISYGKTMRKIILPQATKLMLPNFVNQFVIALKDTTIVSAIGLVELFQTGKIIIARNYQSFKMYAILAVFYLVIITLLTRFAKKLEKKVN